MQYASSKQQARQKYKHNHQQTGLPPHSALPHQRKKKKKNSAQISPFRKFTQTTGPALGRQKPKGRKNSTLNPGKGDLKHNKLKKKIEGREILHK